MKNSINRPIRKQLSLLGIDFGLSIVYFQTKGSGTAKMRHKLYLDFDTNQTQESYFWKFEKLTKKYPE